VLSLEMGLQDEKLKEVKAMPRTIILPVGLSIFRNLEKHHGIKLTPGHETAQLTAQFVESLGEAVDKLSAELSTLKALKASPEDEAVFLATDTEGSESAAKANAIIAEHRFGVATDTERIDSLVLDDAERFKREGIPSFVRVLDRYIERAIGQGHEPLLGVSGGIKPVIPYLAIYGMLRRVPITYIFEMTQDLIWLTPLPIDFDWDGLRRVEHLLRQIEQDVAIERRRLETGLGESLSRLEGLFEDMGEGKMTLSTFGHMLLGDLEHARDIPVMLSPSARRKLKDEEGTRRRQLDYLLDRVRIPQWRAQKRHSFRDTDLDVYKPGNTGLRLAGWVEGEIVYIAELYTSHDEYTANLPGRYRKDYDPSEFEAYTPQVIELDPAKEEVEGDEMIAIAIRDKHRAETERDEALKMATQTEKELERTRRALEESCKEVEELREHVSKLEEERQVRASWSLWRRLRWALFGS